MNSTSFNPDHSPLRLVLMSSAGIQKLFCGIYSTFKCSFDEFVGEKVFSPSYSSAIFYYCDIECFALEMDRDHSVVFEIAPKNCISDCFVNYDGYSISSKRFLPTVVDIMVI